MLNEKTFIVRHPVLTAFLFLMLISVFSALPAILSGILKLSEIHTMSVFTSGFFLSALVAIFIMKRSCYPLAEYGLTLKTDFSFGRFLGFIPLLLVTGVVFTAGIDTTFSVDLLVATFLYVLAASINEELYFRGLILRVLRVKGTGFAIILSSTLFGLAHMGSLAAGKALDHTLLLILFSALFAIVSALLLIATGSIVVPIIWHLGHNIASSITMETSTQVTLAIVGFQCIVLLGYALFLWKKVSIDEHNSLLNYS